MKSRIQVVLDYDLKCKIALEATKRGLSSSAWLRILAIDELGRAFKTSMEAAAGPEDQPILQKDIQPSITGFYTIECNKCGFNFIDTKKEERFCLECK